MLFRSLLLGVLCLCVSHVSAVELVQFETSEGDFTVELYEDKAPKTVKNFLRYVNEGFYENTIFHRVISRFMIQGGGFTRNLEKKDTHAPIANEAANGLRNQTGYIAMARTQDPNSATAQFYINLVDNQSLDYRGPSASAIGYCVFGRVTKGMDVIHKIGRRPTSYQQGYADVPIRPIVIKKVTLLATKKQS